MPRFLYACLLLSLVACLAPCAQGGDAPPNIVFILIDDLGWPALGCYGNAIVPTPHIDSLARDGMRFTQAYVTPQCALTRASLLTGQHTARNGFWKIPGYYYPQARLTEPDYIENLPRESVTVAERLKAASYTTAASARTWPRQTICRERGRAR
ncbi:MAG: sulfatase-like hydrolase/transferase [Planctomycetota bacterium]